MLIAIFLAIGIGGCREDSPLPTPHLPLSLSTSEVWLMVGMESKIVVSNSKEFSVSAEKSGIIATRIENNNILIEALASGEVSLIISDIKDHSRRAVLKITISPIRFGLMDARGVMVLEGHYRFQGPENLHLAPSGTLRKQNYLKIPIEQSLQQGATVSVEYKTTVTEQTLQAKIFLIKNQIIYAIMTDGGYLIFEKK